MGFLRRVGRLPQRLKLTYALIVFVVLFSIGVFIWAIFTGKITPFAAPAEATLNISAGVSYNVGQVFTADILIYNPTQTEISEIAVRFLNYNQSVLEAQSVEGVTLGNLSIVENQIEAGKITYVVRLADSGLEGYRESGRIAIVTFRALAAGRADFTFDFTAGATGDSDVIEKATSTDILVSAPLSFVTIVGSPGGSSPTPGDQTSTPPRSPTPCIKGCSPTPLPPLSELQPTAEASPEVSPTPIELVIGPQTPQTQYSPTPVGSISPTRTPTDEFSDNYISPSASPVIVAGFAISKTVALILYIGIPVVIVLIVFLIWWWKKKKKMTEGSVEQKDEIDDDEII